MIKTITQVLESREFSNYNRNKVSNQNTMNKSLIFLTIFATLLGYPMVAAGNIELTVQVLVALIIEFITWVTKTAYNHINDNTCPVLLVLNTVKNSF